MNIDPSSLVPETVISVDRNTSFVPPSYMGNEYKIVSQDPAALALTSIDLGKVVIIHILDTQGGAKDANTLMQRGMAEVKAKSGILLDAAVAMALIANSGIIPAAWISFAESDNANTTAIEFLGTTFQKEGTDTKYYLSISFDRGVWSYIYTEALYDEPTLTTIAQHPTLRIRRAAAVLIL